MIPIKFRLLDSKDRESYRQIRLECLTNYPEFFGDTYEEEINATTLKFDKALKSSDGNSFLMGAFSGEGIGSELLKFTITKAFENGLIDQILLSVVYTNEKAINLYKKHWFV